MLFRSLKDGSIPPLGTYNTSKSSSVSFGIGAYQSGEKVYQGASLTNSNFTATVSSFDSGNNILSLINTVGTPVLGTAINGNTSGAVRVLLNYTKPTFDVGSGYMSYIENRVPIQRSPTDNEQVRIIIGY